MKYLRSSLKRDSCTRVLILLNSGTSDTCVLISDREGKKHGVNSGRCDMGIFTSCREEK